MCFAFSLAQTALSPIFFFFFCLLPSFVFPIDGPQSSKNQGNAMKKERKKERKNNKKQIL